MMKKKLNNKKGFTLAELLIVVAIIGILVAVSVPVFTNQLSKAKTATDDANMRAAKAAVTAEILAGDITSEKTYYFDAAAGKVTTDSSSITPYGKTTSNSNKIIKITVNNNEIQTSEWAPKQ